MADDILKIFQSPQPAGLRRHGWGKRQRYRRRHGPAIAAGKPVLVSSYGYRQKTLSAFLVSSLTGYYAGQGRKAGGKALSDLRFAAEITGWRYTGKLETGRLMVSKGKKGSRRSL